MKYCKKCGEEMPDRARFCMMCGTPLDIAEEIEETRHLDPDGEILIVDSAEEFTIEEYGAFELSSVQDRYGYGGVVIGVWLVANDMADGVYMSEPYDINIDLKTLGVDPELYEDLELFADHGNGVMDEYPYVIEDDILKTQSRSALALSLVMNGNLWLCEQEHRQTPNDVPYVVENRNRSEMLGDDRRYFYYIKDQRTDKRVFKVYYAPEKEVYRNKWQYEQLEAKALQKVLERSLDDIENEFPELKDCQMRALAALHVKHDLVEECQKTKNYETLKEKAEDSGIPDWARLDDKLMDVWEYICEEDYRIPLDLIKVFVNEGEEREYQNAFTDRWIVLNLGMEDLDYQIVHGIHSVFEYQYTAAYSQDMARLLEAMTHVFVTESAVDLKERGIIEDEQTLLFRPEHYELLAMPMDGMDSDLTDAQKRDYGIALSLFLTYLDQNYQQSNMPDALENISSCCDTCSIAQALTNAYEINVEDFNDYWHDCWTEHAFEPIKAYMSYVKEYAFNQQYQPEKVVFHDNEQYQFVQGKEAFYSVAVRSFIDADHDQTAIILDFSDTDPDAIIDMKFVSDMALTPIEDGYFLAPGYGERMVLEICGGEEEFEGYGENWGYHAAVLTPRHCDHRIESSTLVIDYPEKSEAAERGWVKGYKAIITTSEGQVEKYDSSFGQSIHYPLSEVNLMIGQPYDITVYEYVVGTEGDTICGPSGNEKPEEKIYTTGELFGDEPNAPQILASMTEAPQYECPYCQAEVTEDADFCPQCGKPLHATIQEIAVTDILLEIDGEKTVDNKYTGTTRDSFPLKYAAKITQTKNRMDVKIEQMEYATRFFSTNPTYHVTGKTTITGFGFTVDTTSSETVMVDGVTPKQRCSAVSIDTTGINIIGGRDDGWPSEDISFHFRKDGHTVEYIMAGEGIMILDCNFALEGGRFHVTLMNDDFI